MSLAVNTPVAILFALMLNELRDGVYKRIVQSVSYFPYFVSTVVVVGMLSMLLNPVDGIASIMLRAAGREPISFMTEASWFRRVYVLSGLWQSFGWSAIIYIGAISGVEAELYEAASIDGAGLFQRILHITMPSIVPVIMTVLILSMGNILNVGFEKIILMYSPSNYETADVISTYVYRIGIQNAQYSFGAAVGFFNSVVNTAFIIMANFLSRRLSGTYIW